MSALGLLGAVVARADWVTVAAVALWALRFEVWARRHQKEHAQHKAAHNQARGFRVVQSEGKA